MPELPEVETVRATLAPRISGRRITGCRITWHRLPAYPGLETFAARLCGRRLERVARRGKYLIMELEPAGRWVIHLRMTGRIQYLAAGDPAAAQDDPHRHGRVRFSDGGALIYHDVRKFGRWYLLPPGPFRRERGAPPGLVHLGPEPLSAAFDAAYLQAAVRNRGRSIKSLLLDQSVVAGLGNIYVDEALHRAGIAPRAASATVTDQAAVRLHGAIRQVLQDALDGGGTSLRDYRDGLGRRGAYSRQLRVYGRAGEPCPACETPIVRDVIAGRATAYCPACQQDTG